MTELHNNVESHIYGQSMTIKGSSMVLQVSSVDHVFEVPIFNLQSQEHCV